MTRTDIQRSNWCSPIRQVAVVPKSRWFNPLRIGLTEHADERENEEPNGASYHGRPYPKQVVLTQIAVNRE